MRSMRSTNRARSLGAKVLFNNLVWPEATPAERERIEQSAQGILEARSLYPDASLATLYDPDLMPSELRTAHRENDRAVEAAYDLPSDSSEADIVSHLFALYAAKWPAVTPRAGNSTGSSNTP